MNLGKGSRFPDELAFSNNEGKIHLMKSKDFQEYIIFIDFSWAIGRNVYCM